MRGPITAIAVPSLIAIAGCAEVPLPRAFQSAQTAGVEVASAQVTPSRYPTGKSSAGNYLAGRFAHKVGDFSKAADFLNYALGKDPENRSLLRRAYMVSIADGRMTEAADLAGRLYKVEPNAPLAGTTLAVDEIRRGKLADAQKRLKSQRVRGFNRYIVPLVLGWTQVGQGKVDEGLATMKPLKDYPGFSTIYRLHVGMVQDYAGDNAAAEKSYLAASKETKRLSLRVVQALGSLYERTGRADEAKALYLKYKKENPESLILNPALDRLEKGGKPAKVISTAQQGVAEAFFNLSGSLTQDNSAQLALIFGRMALALRSEFPLAQLLVGGILEGLGRQKDAIALYDSIPAASPLKWTARLRKAASLNSLGKKNEAIDQLKAMANEERTRTDALIDLGDMLRAGKRFNESVSAYDRAVQRIDAIDKRHWAILYSRGIALERSKQWSRAEKDFLHALKLNPEQPYVLNYLGYTWVDQGVNIKRARRMIERAVELRPNDGYIVDSLGWALYRMKDYPAAVKQLERAVELRPQDATINDHLGDAYWTVGRHIEARFQWRRALALDPEPEFIDGIKEKIKKGLVKKNKTQGGS